MKKKVSCNLILSGILTLSFMVVIFYFSSKTADESSGQSVRFVELFIKCFVNSFDEMSSAKQMQIRELLSSVIRECAHCIEFGCLGLSLMYHMNCIGKGFRVSLLLGLIYSISDELHQIFVPGRAFQLIDILIDYIGLFLGCGFVYLLAKCSNRRKNI